MSTSSALSALSLSVASMMGASATEAKSRTRRKQPSGDAGRAARAPRDLVRAVGADGGAEYAGRPRHHQLQLRHAVEVEADGDAEAVAQRRRQQPKPRGGADERELGEVDAHRARGRPLADDEVELVVLERGIEDLLDRRAQAVDLVDEQHVAVFEVGQQRREIAGLGDDRTRGGAEADTELPGHDLRERRLAEARRSGEQHMVERLAAIARGLDEDAEVGARLLLADELGERARPQRGLGGVGVALGGGDEPVGHGLFTCRCSASSSRRCRDRRTHLSIAATRPAGSASSQVHWPAAEPHT